MVDSVEESRRAQRVLADAELALREAKVKSLGIWLTRQRLQRRLTGVKQQLAYVENAPSRRRQYLSVLERESRQAKGRDRRRWEAGVRKIEKREVGALARKVKKLNKAVASTRKAVESANRRRSRQRGS